MAKNTYKTSGVDIDAGNQAAQLIKKMIHSTYTQNVLLDTSGFGPFFDLSGYKQPVLISSTDGVGTKLKIAFMLDKHDTVGIDLVAMVVNDILRSGAKPLFLLDYIAVNQLKQQRISQIISGIVAGCQQAGCALIGGEIAEMPDLYSQGEYDLAGFVVGVCEKGATITGTTIQAGDLLLGLPSTGIHSNGFSLVRSVFNLRGNTLQAVNNLNKYYPELQKTLGEELLTPTRIYAKETQQALNKLSVKGFAHITGGGLREKILPTIPSSLGIEINTQSWQPQTIFLLIQQRGSITRSEMYRVFNMGIGYVLVIEPKERTKALELFPDSFIFGQVVALKNKKERIMFI